MKLKNLLCISLGLLSFHAYSNVELSEKELLEKKNINAKYHSYDSEMELKRLYDQVNVAHYNIENISNLLSTSLKKFQLMSESVINSMNNSSKINTTLSQNLSDNILSYETNLTKLSEEQKTYNELNKSIQIKEEYRIQENKKRELELNQLRDSIVERLKYESAQVNTLRFNGTTKCKSTEGPATCLNRKIEMLIDNHMESYGNSYRIKKYNIEDANLNISGVLNYVVKLDYTVPFSVESIKEINNKLGLESTHLKLSSNVEATYFVNGVNVGTGKEVIIKDKFSGKVVIKASYDDYIQSSIGDMSKMTEFYYPFQKTKIEQAN